MLQPSQRETTNRDEMICPRCDTEGLEENPAYRGEYKGRSALLKSTRCPNEECDYHYGLPKDEVQKQMPEGRGNILSNLIPTDIEPMQAVKFAFIFLGLLTLGFQLGLIPFGSDTTSNQNSVLSNIDGQVIDVDEISDVSNLTVNLRNNQGETVDTTSTDSDGSFSFNNIDEGEYIVYVSDSSLGLNPPGENIDLTSDTENVEIDLVESETQVIDQMVDNATISLDYTNPENIQDINLQLIPIEGDNVERTQEIESGVEETILTPIAPRSEQIRVNAPVTTEEKTLNRLYEGEEEEFNIDGNMQPEDFSIGLTNQTDSEINSETINVPSSGTTEDIFVSGNETVGSAILTLRDGTAQERNQEIGSWQGEDEISFYTGVDSYTSASLSIEPIISESTNNITGQINSDSITYDFNGNKPIEDAEIEFKGGDSSVSSIGSEDIDISAENGTTDEESIEIAEVSDSGNYRLDFELGSIENEELVNFYYEINGEQTQIEDDVSEVYSLDSGDIITIVYQAERETTVRNDGDAPLSADSLHDNLVVNDVRFSDEEPEVGDNISPYITIENTGNSDITDDISVFYDGNEEASTTETIPSGEEIEIGGINTFGSINLNEEGTSVWYTNQQGPFFLDIGDSEPVFGEGSLTSDVVDLSSQGEINIDTTGDGELDCTAVADSDSCSFGTLDPTGTEFAVEQNSVDNTNYEISYTERNAPRDITVDIGDDNITDLSYDGILNESESINNQVEIGSGNETVKFDSGNNVGFEYAFSWDSDSVLDNPVVDVNGETVVRDEDSFQEEKEFDIGILEEGDNEFRFRSSSGGYTADIEWVEDEGQSYPSVLLNNREVCNTADFANNLTCSVDVEDENIEQGTNTIDFTETSQSTINYQLNYVGRASAGHVDIDVNDDTMQFDRPSTTPREWEDVSSTSMLDRGENEVYIESPEQNNIRPESITEFSYSIDTGSVENPEIIVENSDGESYTVDIPDESIESNQLSEETEVTIPSDWLTLSENTVIISTDDGVFEIYGEIEGSEEVLSFEET